MFLIAIFAAIFGAVFAYFRMKGEKTADCLHKGLVAGIVCAVAALILATAFSYI